jgi:hypothetical protein
MNEDQSVLLKVFHLLFFTFCFLCLPTYSDEVVLDSLTGDDAAFTVPNQVVQFKHVFWVNFDQTLSKTSYRLAPQEIIHGRLSGNTPNIKINGNLVLQSPLSADKCMVRLPSASITAYNQDGKQIKINLRGSIGGKILGTDFVRPDFDQTLTVPFSIEGYIDQSSLAKGLTPGSYNFNDALKLIVEFND